MVEAVRGSNNDAGGRLIEFGGTEYMVRGRGYAKSVQDFGEYRPLGERERLADPRPGRGRGGPRARTIGGGSPTSTAKGEAVSGIVVMRQGQNALEVIERVKKKIREIEPGLPAGVEDRPRLRPVGADQPRDRQPEVDHRRGDDHRFAGGAPLPLAFPERRHPHHHHPRSRS